LWCALCDFLTFGLKSIFQQSSTHFYLWKQGLVAAFCDSFLMFGLKSIFQSHPISTYESRDWVMLLVIPFLCLVLRVFFNSPTHPST
jgi:hypothetical protein